MRARRNFSELRSHALIEAARNGGNAMRRLYLASSILALGLGACGYNNNYNNEAAYNEAGAYNETGNYATEGANYTGEEANYSANAMANDMNATVNDVNAVTNY
jgi:hypothetical protein